MAREAKSPDRLAKQFKALADARRLEILDLLKRKGCCSCDEVSAAEPGMCVCDIETALGDLSQPTISHHLDILRRADLIETRKIGRWVYCRRNEPAIEKLVAVLGRRL